jgi:hypothetical protein
MKKVIIILTAVFMSSAALFSNPAIMGKHKDQLKDGKKVDCGYCHQTGLKIPQKKGQIKDSKLNGKKYSQIKGCNGKGCHI